MQTVESAQVNVLFIITAIAIIIIVIITELVGGARQDERAPDVLYLTAYYSLGSIYDRGSADRLRATLTSEWLRHCLEHEIDRSINQTRPIE